MKNRAGKKSPLMAEINVVPYIDVMLVLLVIFMITAPLLSQGVQINLPQATSKPLADSKRPMIISVNVQGKYFLNTAANPSQPLPPDVLVNQINAQLSIDKQQNKQRAILIKGDRDTSYGKIIQVMAFLQSSGIDEVGLITEAPPQNSNTAK